MPNEALYYVDYIFYNQDVNPQHILDIAEMDSYWGKDMDESLVAIENLVVTENMVTLMSPDKTPTLKITLPNNISIIKFGSSQEEYESLLAKGFVKINLVAKCNKNEWNGWVTPQLLVEEYEIIQVCNFLF